MPVQNAQSKSDNGLDAMEIDAGCIDFSYRPNRQWVLRLAPSRLSVCLVTNNLRAGRSVKA
jgi:hypothetical protein